MPAMVQYKYSLYCIEMDGKTKRAMWGRFQSALAKAPATLKAKWAEIDDQTKWRAGKTAQKNSFLMAWNESKAANQEWDSEFFATVFEKENTQGTEDKGIWVARGRLQ